ncbi:MAG TPA: DUF1840 domain-containing protein [Alcaligenaceae bacterium]|nr:DUF1840 domain-containing protein [Alcaligenaceae bacterium]
MLITFSSKAGADILMLSQHAQPIMRMIGKISDQNIPERGVFTPEQLVGAIFALEQAIADEKPPQEPDEDDPDAIKPDALSLPVALRQRAQPLLDLMRRSQKAGVPLSWEAGSGW